MAEDKAKLKEEIQNVIDYVNSGAIDYRPDKIDFLSGPKGAKNLPGAKDLLTRLESTEDEVEIAKIRRDFERLIDRMDTSISHTDEKVLEKMLSKSAKMIRHYKKVENLDGDMRLAGAHLEVLRAIVRVADGKPVDRASLSKAVEGTDLEAAFGKDVDDTALTESLKSESVADHIGEIRKVEEKAINESSAIAAERASKRGAFRIALTKFVKDTTSFPHINYSTSVKNPVAKALVNTGKTLAGIGKWATHNLHIVGAAALVGANLISLQAAAGFLSFALVVSNPINLLSLGIAIAVPVAAKIVAVNIRARRQESLHLAMEARIREDPRNRAIGKLFQRALSAKDKDEQIRIVALITASLTGKIALKSKIEDGKEVVYYTTDTTRDPDTPIDSFISNKGADIKSVMGSDPSINWGNKNIQLLKRDRSGKWKLTRRFDDVVEVAKVINKEEAKLRKPQLVTSTPSADYNPAKELKKTQAAVAKEHRRAIEFLNTLDEILTLAARYTPRGKKTADKLFTYDDVVPVLEAIRSSKESVKMSHSSLNSSLASLASAREVPKEETAKKPTITEIRKKVAVAKELAKELDPKIAEALDKATARIAPKKKSTKK